MRSKIMSLLVLLTISLVSAAAASASRDAKVPEPLQPWVDWVLHDHEEELFCTPNADDVGSFRCNWPTALALEVGAEQGSFSQEWLLEYESWIQLPGDEDNWPHDVSINGRPGVILNQGGVPRVKLPAGEYRIRGAFSWAKMPEFLRISPGTALLDLEVKGRAVPLATLDDSGRVWLHSKGDAQKVIEDRLNIESFRLIDDRIPVRVILQLNLDVAGSAREVVLGAPFSRDRFIPVSLQSSLPARLEKDGRIRLQVRPGTWQLTLTARHIGPLSELPFERPDHEYWPEEEIWVFAKRNNRIVDIEGVPSIDPQQTGLPPQWRNDPAYRLADGDVMKFKMIKRGDPDPAPDQLTLQRSLWLRFDGSGYAIQDRISGKKTSDWRLEMTPPISLDRVAVGGRDRFITRLEGSEKTGIELRNGLVDITADSEYRGVIGEVPAVGWDHDFQQVGARLFLPPGYRLLHATGIDNIPDTWLNSWTLLDIFVLLIFTIALARLYSWPMALVGFVTMALLYHEPDAPRWVWLALLAGVALVRTVPEGRFLKAVKVYQLAVILLLIVIAIPFSVQQLRVGIYPQLERPWQVMAQYHPAAPEAQTQQAARLSEGPVEIEVRAEESDLARAPEPTGKPMLKSVPAVESRYPGSMGVAQYDPSMINQTGPGIPAWRWDTVQMSWSGPVKRDQAIGLFLIGPTSNLVLAFARVGLMVILALGLLGFQWRRDKGFGIPDPKTFLPLLLLVLLPLLAPDVSQADEIPSPKMFEELRQRLLEKEDCFPGCADIPTMKLDIDRTDLAIEFEVAAQTKVAIPLPGSPKHWLAARVHLDARPAAAMYRTNQGLWLVVPEGRHSVIMRGKIPPNDTLQVSLPLKPHRVEVVQDGWTTAGNNRGGPVDNQLHFKRVATADKDASRILETGVLPPFVRIERSLRLGLDWRVITRVMRISPPGPAITLDYPLLPGEAVITEGVRVEDGTARINLDPQAGLLTFESILEKKKSITLGHADTRDWTETWQVDVSPIFHMEYNGIPVILHQSGDRWVPKWHPWPGETVQLTVTRPEGVEGQSVTIDRSHLVVRPGQRVTDATLELSLQSSQGGQHIVTLPPDSRLQEVLIDGRVQSIRQEGRAVPLPINPGRQNITLKWREAGGITTHYQTPEVDLGLVNANTNIDLHLPANRWPLLVGGPVIGPAVLFWSVVLVIVLAAFGLARSRLTHLKFYELLLLGIGMSQSHLLGILLVVGWLIALNFREKIDTEVMDHNRFNLMQILLGLLTVLALVAIVFAISMGLLGHPDMNIVGNGSNRNLLRWYQDYNSGVLPRPWLLSVPLFWYRLAMLAWALWLSFMLTGILRYGWQVFSKPVFWYPDAVKVKTPRRKAKSAGSPGEVDADFEFEEERDDDKGKDGK